MIKLLKGLETVSAIKDDELVDIKDLPGKVEQACLDRRNQAKR